jgi:hypothetical protein
MKELIEILGQLKSELSELFSGNDFAVVGINNSLNKCIEIATVENTPPEQKLMFASGKIEAYENVLEILGQKGGNYGKFQ